MILSRRERVSESMRADLAIVPRDTSLLISSVLNRLTPREGLVCSLLISAGATALVAGIYHG